MIDPETTMTYLGLPIPGFNEADILRREQSGDFGNDSLNFYTVGAVVLAQNPELGVIIQHDMRQWSEFEAHEDFTPDETVEYKNGMESGYEYLIGFVTYTRFLRSSHTEMPRFVAEARDHEHVPVLGQSEVERIKAVRAGHAILDIAVQERLDHSGQLADEDAGDYMFQAIRLDEMVAEEINALECLIARALCTTVDDDRVAAHIEGFRHGMAQAVELYIQTHEEKTLAAHRN